MPREMHPTGNYDAEITDHGFNAAKTGTIQFWAVFRTEKGDITGYFPMTDKAAEMSLEKIVAMGFAGTAIETLGDGKLLLGNRCVITVKHREWNGEVKDEVAWVNPEGWTPGPRRDDEVTANVSKFNGLLAKIQANKPTDDVPF